MAESGSLQAGVDVGTSYLGRDGFVDASPWLEFAGGAWQGGLGAPVRFRVLDGDPKDGCHTPGIRCQDWDEKTDFARILRHLDYGGWSGDVNVHVGDLTGISLGHGELVSRYYNNWQFDHWHTGALVDVQKPDFGLSLLAGDVLAGDLLAVRAWGRPVSEGYWQRLRFGLQAAVDRQVRLGNGTQGDPHRDAGPWSFDAPLLAMDLSLLLKGDDVRALSTYLALSGHLTDAVATHLGLTFHKRGDPAVAMSLETRAVATIGAAGSLYLPGWFGALYELDARSMRSAVSANAAAHTGGTAGARATFELARVGKFRFAATYDWLYDRRNELMVWLSTDKQNRLSVRTMLAKRFGAPGSGDPVGWTGSLAAKLRVTGWWHATLSAGRKWFDDGATAGGLSPVYAETEVRLAVGTEWWL